MVTAVLSIGILGGQMEIQANRKYTYWDNFMCNTQFHVYALHCLSDHPTEKYKYKYKKTLIGTISCVCRSLSDYHCRQRLWWQSRQWALLSYFLRHIIRHTTAIKIQIEKYKKCNICGGNAMDFTSNR